MELINDEKMAYVAPTIEVLGRIDELTGSGGSGNPDGAGHAVEM